MRRACCVCVVASPDVNTHGGFRTFYTTIALRLKFAEPVKAAVGRLHKQTRRNMSQLNSVIQGEVHIQPVLYLEAQMSLKKPKLTLGF